MGRFFGTFSSAPILKCAKSLQQVLREAGKLVDTGPVTNAHGKDQLKRASNIGENVIPVAKTLSQFISSAISALTKVKNVRALPGTWRSASQGKYNHKN